MKARCLNEKHDHYERYGGSGIKICKRWLKFENFLEDMGEPPIGCVLDRINNDGNYCKSNCRWATFKESTANRKNTIYVEGEGVNDMANRTGIPAWKIYQRLGRGWSKAKIESAS